MTEISKQNGIIYGLINSDTLEIRYIGKTILLPEKRLIQHKRRKDNKHLRNWLVKYPVSIIVLECVGIIENLNVVEIRWIADMRAQGARLLNLTDGGEGILGHPHTLEAKTKMRGRKLSLETKAKMSASKIGNKYSLGHTYSRTTETKDKLSAAMMGRQNAKGCKHTKVSAETRAKIGATQIGNQHMLGRKLSDITKTKMSISHKGFKHTVETKKKISVTLRNLYDK